MAGIPDKPTLDGIEDRWSDRWEAERVYRFDRDAAQAGGRDSIFSVDTPPPTVSGSIHMGTVFGYTQFDAVARFQRMRGKHVFFPIGWDDNGLATERRVQNYYGVRCDPTQPYDAAFQPPFRGDVPAGSGKASHREVPISRPNFIALCEELTAIDESVFESLFRRLGLSFDWTLLYTTVGDESRRTSQLAFLHNLERGEAYSADAPTVWDVDDRTAVAQAEIEDREVRGAYHRIAFHGAGTPDVIIETSRPELIISCCALVAHPDDERYRPLFGTTVRTPLFGVEVPVVAHHLAQPDKGTGIAMICTFGDVTDVTWWRELRLPTRNVIGRDGRILAATPEWIAGDEAAAQYARIAGSTVKQAQAATVDALRESGELLEEPKPITHPVKFYERGRRPLEIVSSRQWYIRNGGRDDALREALIGRGKELVWHPEHMRYRYENWVEGLNGDWLISRQRFFGVPIPLWYPIGDDGEVDYDHPIVPAAGALPIDPQSDVPPGYTADQRGAPGGFAGDPDIMDTWATSSLTPQIAGHWADEVVGRGDGLFDRIFPMDVRPQGPEIIRTWLFSTVVRAHFEHGSLPWHDTMINGWILDPDRKKMSKSKGNVVTPEALFDTYGTDAVRYWSLAARPGVDTAFSEEQMKVGRRLATKLLNVTKFVLGIGEPPAGDVSHVAAPLPVDAAMLARLDAVVGEATRAFAGFDYARALERTEEFFWWFCDDYVELVKSRAYGTTNPTSPDGAPSAHRDAAAASARVALRRALDVLQRLFAPILPFAAEEAWSWWHETSVHSASWPEPGGDHDGVISLDAASDVLATVRRAKTEAKLSQRAGVATLTLAGPPEWIAGVEAARADLIEALTVGELVAVEAAEVSITSELAPPAPPASSV